MSQPNHKYKRLEALFSGTKPVDPNPATQPVKSEADALKARIIELEAKLDNKASVEETKLSMPLAQETAGQKPLRQKKAGKSEAIEQQQPLPEGKGDQARSVFLSAMIFFIVNFVAALYWLYIGFSTGTVQFYVLAAVLFTQSVMAGFGAILSRRGQPTTGILLVLGTAVLYPYSATLVSGFGLVTGLGTLIAGPIMSFPVLPRRSAWGITIVTTTLGLASILIDVFGSAARPSLPGIFIQLLAALAVGVLGYVIVRQAIAGNIRTKLVTAFVFMAVLSVGIVAFSTQSSFSKSLTGNIGTNLAELANTKAIEIGQTVDRESDLLKALALNSDIREAAASANGTNILSQADIDRLDKQWRSADAADNNFDPLVVDVLYNGVSNELRQFQKEFSQHVEVFLTDRQGVNIASTNRTSDYYQADEEWWQTAYQGGIFIGQPVYDESSKTIAITMATAIRDSRSGNVTGVLRTTVNFTTLSESLIAGQFGQTGHTDIYLPNGQELTLKTMDDGSLELVMKDAGLDVNSLAQSAKPYTEISHDGVTTLASQALMNVPGDTEADTQAITNLDWHIVVMQDRAEALQPVYAQTRNIIILVIFIIIAVVFVAFVLARFLSSPIIRLNAVAGLVSSGDLTAEAKVETHDEIGTLATTFNYMTSQLRSLFGSLEQRVQDRTHDLELASEVGRTITEKISNLDEMLTVAAEMIRSRFELYYTQVYITDATGRSLVLRAGTGEVGEQLLKRGHRLLIDSGSLNGQAVLQKKPIIVADTLQSSNFKPNRLLPNTRSEMAVPLIVGDQVIGVLDMQSERPGSLNESNLPAFEALGGQLAIALQNASLFARAEEARAEVEAQMRDLTERGWKEFMNAIDRGQRIGYAYDRSQIAALDETALTSIPAGQAVSIPIQVTGAKVGMIQVANESGRNLTGDEQELLEATANQLSQHIENLRLLAQAEGYRAEAEEALRRLTREGWDMLQMRSDMAPGYAFDLNEVKPISHNWNGNNGSAYKQPLVVRDETIGEVYVDDVHQQEEAGEIIEAVARQLSGHIENLRLLETTEYELAERTRTEQELLKVRLGMDRANDAVFMTDTDGTIVYVNPAFQRIYGWTKEEAIGQTPRIIKSGVIPQERYKEFWGALLSNQVVAGEIVNKTKDGRLIPIEGSNNPIIDTNGKVIGFLALHRDITDRKHAEEIITKHTREMETVAELSTTTSTVLDPDTLLQTVVDLTKERFGLYHAHIYLADESWKTLLLAAGAGEVGRQMVAEGWNIPMDHQQSIVAGAARNRQSVIANNMSRDKHTAFLSNYLLPDTRSEMAVPMIVGDRLLGVFDVQAATANYFSDEDANLYTTLAAQVAVALQNARLYAEQTATVTQLRELDRLKSSFLANMSHELRTPLNSILGFSDVMLEELDGPLTVNMQNDLGLIQKNGQHLLHLINDVLDMAKIESGRMNLNPEKIKVHEILEEVTSITSTLASEKNIALFIETDSDRDVEIFADRTRLRQVMINLVNNSIKFTEKGKISIHASSQNEHVLIRVKDTGIGIPADKLEDVFQEFAQVDSSTTRKAGGTGLGLPISRRLIAMHGGRLWAESSGIENEGSTFFVELPLEAQLTETAEKVVR